MHFLSLVMPSIDVLYYPQNSIPDSRAVSHIFTAHTKITDSVGKGFVVFKLDLYINYGALVTVEA